MSTYELQGGSANMFINDDGLQLIDEKERMERIEFYADNSIGWTARPKQVKGGFTRKGKFKKVCEFSHMSISRLYPVSWLLRNVALCDDLKTVRAGPSATMGLGGAADLLTI